MENVDETILLDKLKKKDYQAFTTLYELLWEDLFLYVQRLVLNENDAQDIVQETFLVIWKLQGEMGHVQSLKAYCLTIARHQALRQLRNKTYKTELIDDFAAYLKDHEPSVIDLLIKDELTSFIDHEVESLPGRMKETFRKSREEGLSHKRIAEEMGVSNETVKKQINYSLRHLRLKISRFNGLFIFFKI